ncbi:hypothetical protein PYW08_016660 [Mythimna loreyi]|uniref:Uncharacterized protein n=1 Tax=Mythimna loreyi TaxID=667449 RepID=A0ACC2QXN0_9NEOP|nr:hypothetical protein PYW08_016660 [Mythimna loreyi]
MFDIICFTEHWLKDFQMLINYENYNVGSCFNRNSMLRGGSLILIKSSIKFKTRKDIVALSIEHSIELSCVELDRHIIVCVYRPPNYQNYSIFESVMEDVMAKLSNSNKLVIICGDFNVNILENNSESCRFLNLFKSFNLSNVFIEPTRTSTTSATCIDNVFCCCDYLDKAIVDYLPSDHSGLMVTFESDIPIQQVQIHSRPITSGKLNKFNSTLINKLNDWKLAENDGNILYNDFFSIIHTEFNKNFEKKTRCVNPKFRFSDWATKGIRISRERLFELYGLKPIIKTDTFNKYVAMYSKMFKNTCKAAKALYISNKVKSADNKIKTVWKIINNETNRNKTHNNDYTLETHHGIVSDNKLVAQEFVNFFTSIPIKTTESLNSSPSLAFDLLQENVPACPTEFNFKHINPITVI